jgi:hypothetical protein
VNYFALAVRTARDTFTYAPAVDPRAIQIDGLTITPDAMPHHFIAQARILDLQPTQMVPALVAIEQEIRTRYPHMHRTGWRAASDGLRIYFTAWTRNGGAR